MDPAIVLGAAIFLQIAFGKLYILSWKQMVLSFSVDTRSWFKIYCN